MLLLSFGSFVCLCPRRWRRLTKRCRKPMHELEPDPNRGSVADQLRAILSEQAEKGDVEDTPKCISYNKLVEVLCYYEDLLQKVEDGTLSLEDGGDGEAAGAPAIKAAPSILRGSSIVVKAPAKP